MQGSRKEGGRETRCMCRTEAQRHIAFIGLNVSVPAQRGTMSVTEWASGALINDPECSRKAARLGFPRPTHRSPSSTTTGMWVGGRSVLV